MSLYRKAESLKAQIVETERLLETVMGHPLMSMGLEERLSDLKAQLQNIPETTSEPKVKLLFSGRAVIGSLGIKSSFVSKTVAPFQEMVKTQFALIRSGVVGKRGQTKNKQNTELYITSLPVGSFGIELSQLEGLDLFAESDVSSAIQQIIQLVVSASSDDQSFENSIDGLPTRNLANLKKFLQEIVHEDSMLKMESGNLSVKLERDEVRDAYERVSLTAIEEDEVFISGILRGLLLDSGRFEFQDEAGLKYSGRISPELIEEQLINYKSLLNEPCQVHLLTSKTTLKAGKEKIQYELIEILVYR